MTQYSSRTEAAKTLAGQFIRFCLIGVVNTATSYAIFFLLYWWAGVYYLLAGGIGYLTGAIVSFFLNRSFTFRSSLGTFRGLPLYVGTVMLSLGAHVLTQSIATGKFGIDPLLSQIVGTAITTLLNFFLARLLLYRPG